MTAAIAVSPRRRWLPWIGALVGMGSLAWVLHRLDVERFLKTLASANFIFLSIVPVSLLAEQLVRGWKWRQILSPLKLINTVRLFGAVMAGYLLASLIPFGFGTVARSWIVARHEDLDLPCVLATVVVDRITDGMVFACLVPLALVAVAFEDPGGIRTGLMFGAAASLTLFLFIGLALRAYKNGLSGERSYLMQFFDKLPIRLRTGCRRVALSFGQGVIWPKQIWRGAGIVCASVAIKLTAASHFLWAGLAFGLVLEPGQYLLILVFLGFLIVLGHFARVAGSFLLGGIFVLELLEVPKEQALAMVLVIEGAHLLTIAVVGALAIWWQGISMAELRATNQR